MDKMKQTFQFRVKNFRENEDEKSHIGTVEGHISTFGNVDRDGDIFESTAFDRTLIELQSSGKIFLPMLWQHKIDAPIGGFPLREMRTDGKGLFVVGEINLETQGGRDAFALLKQGVINEFSIGFIPKESRIEGKNRIFEDVDLLEASLVTIPSNTQATITNVKSVVPFQNIPIACRNGEPDRSLRWDSKSAERRIQEFTKCDGEPSVEYKTAFLMVDCENSGSFDAYKLPIVDVIDGKLAVIPRAVFAAASALQGACSGIDMSDSDRRDIIKNLEIYYHEMGYQSPFEKGFGINEIKSSPIKTVKKMLQRGTHFTKAGADMMAGLEAGRRKSVVSNDRDSSGINDLKQSINQLRELSDGGSRHKGTHRSGGGSTHHSA